MQEALKMSDSQEKLQNTPLYDVHLRLGAKMVPFSGWNMPLQYTGIIEEHLHTRQKAGLFDICHMGEFFLKGPLAEKDLDKLVTCRVDDMEIGKCRYGFLLNGNAGIIDDLIVFKISPQEFMLVVNAGRITEDKSWIKGKVSPGTEFRDETQKIAKLDLQGPSSGRVLETLLGPSVIQGIKRYYFTHVKIGGVKILLSRTGYTGELGYELFFPREEAKNIWEKLINFSEVKPIGLGARDTLRMEMGYSLYGNDISELTTPFEANLKKFVFTGKDFIGKSALLKENTSRLLMGFICEARRSARSHFKVLFGGRTVGEVTSGAFSPCLKKGIGLCYISKELAEDGREIVLSDERTQIKAALKKIPIYTKQ